MTCRSEAAYLLAAVSMTGCSAGTAPVSGVPNIKQPRFHLDVTTFLAPWRSLPPHKALVFERQRISRASTAPNSPLLPYRNTRVMAGTWHDIYECSLGKRTHRVYAAPMQNQRMNSTVCVMLIPARPPRFRSINVLLLCAVGYHFLGITRLPVSFTLALDPVFR